MATAAKIGRGSKLYYETSVGSGTYTAIPECKSIGSPEEEAAEVDATNMDSPGLSREKIPGLEESGSMAFTCNYIKTTVTALRAIKGTTRSWKILYPDSSYWIFSGNLKKAVVNDEDADVMTIDGEITVSGLPTFTAG